MMKQFERSPAFYVTEGKSRPAVAVMCSRFLSVDEPRVVTWLLLNPSTADEFKNDQTIRRCMGFAQAWGFHELMIVNAYAWRSTNPRGLRSPECLAAGGPVGEGNDAAITAACARAEQVVCGWGRHLQPDRRAALARLLADVKLTALATNDDGSPSHPLRLPGSLKPQPFTLAEAPHG